ncbi:hypothetical protein BH09PSE5_BH09PSE5_08380 [soil metagenome]
MNIALDYDGTFTADPDLWLAFIESATARGHVVHIVTARYGHECDHTQPGLFDPRLITLGIKVIATDREPKRQWCFSKHDTHMHVWIDDTPEAIGPSIRWAKEGDHS